MFGAASNNEEEVDVVSNPTTLSGKPAAFDGPIRVTQQDGNATFRQDPATPNVVTLVSPDEPGVSHFLLEADVDRGDGVKLISEVVEYVVSGAEAAAFGLVTGPTRPKQV